MPANEVLHPGQFRLFDPADHPVTYQGGVVTMGKDEQRTLHEYLAQSQQRQVTDSLRGAG